MTNYSRDPFDAGSAEVLGPVLIVEWYRDREPVMLLRFTTTLPRWIIVPVRMAAGRSVDIDVAAAAQLADLTDEQCIALFESSLEGDGLDVLYPCPCCGYLIFPEPPGSFEICAICFWEDDAVQLEYATTLDEAANDLTLVEAQRVFASRGVSATRLAPYVRPPGSSDRRDPSWRPIDPARDQFPEWSRGDEGAPPFDGRRSTAEMLYYWRDTFWNRRRGGS